jgi:hypothetical protein
MSSSSGPWLTFGEVDVYEEDAALLSSPTSWWTDHLLHAFFELMKAGEMDGVSPALHRFIAPETAFILLHETGQRRIASQSTYPAVPRHPPDDRQHRSPACGPFEGRRRGWRRPPFRAQPREGGCVPSVPPVHSGPHAMGDSKGEYEGNSHTATTTRRCHCRRYCPNTCRMGC